MKNIFVVILTTILITSCERDVTVKVPPHTTKLVVNGITRTNAQFRVSVGKTAGILDLTDASSYRVTNALVQLYENDILKDTLVYNPTADSYTVKNNTRPQSGSRYLLKASAPGINPVEAETVTPATVNIQSITKRMNARRDANGNSLDEVKISFVDDGSITNYYLIKVRMPAYANGNNVEYRGVYCMHTTDKDIERKNNADPTDFENCVDEEFFLADKNFNGRTKEIILFIEHSNLDPWLSPTNNRFFRPIVELHSITQEHYKFRKSYDAYRDAEDNPFAEPVLVYGNVKNGYGIFTSFALARDTIR